MNVDSLVFNGISYGLDGTKKELKPGSDYTVKQSGGEGSWKEYYIHDQKKKTLKKGRYNVTINSKEKTTNKMNNKVKECNIDFVIDKTPDSCYHRYRGVKLSCRRERNDDQPVRQYGS